MRLFRSGVLLLAVVCSSFLLASTSQAAITLPQPSGPITATQAWVFSFKDFDQTQGAAANLLSNQLQVYVFESNEVVGTANLAHRINFMFTNYADSPGVKSSMTEVFFSDGAYLAPEMLLVDQSAGVSYGAKKDGGQLDSPPQMNGVWPRTTAYAGSQAKLLQGDLSPEPTSPGGYMDNGINHNDEWLIVSFNYVTGKTFQDVIYGLRTDEVPTSTTNPLFQIAAHMQSIGANGLSDTYTLDGTSGHEIKDGTGGTGGGEGEGVPEPSTLAIWALGLGIAGRVRLRRQR